MSNKIRIPLIIIGFALAVLSGWVMVSRLAAEELWGYWPLGLFMGGWMGLALLTGKRWAKHPQPYRLLGLSTLTGILLWLGFPNLPFTTLMFVGFVPLLLVEKTLADWREAPAKWLFFKYSYHSMVVWNILTTFWVANTAFFAGVFAIFVNSLFMAIPLVLFHQVRKRLPSLGYAAFIAFWLAFEYLHMRHQLSWPWLTLGNSFAQYPSWVQWYEYTGVFGGSLWILVANVFFLKLVQNYYFKRIKIALRKTIRPLLLILIPILISLVMYYRYEEGSKTIEVVVVQPNFEPHYEKFNIGRLQQFRRFMQLSTEAVGDSTDYLVFPETSFGGIDQRNPMSSSVVQDLRAFVDQKPGLKLVTGVSSRRIFRTGETHTESTREYVDPRTGQITYWEAYNAAMQIESGRADIQSYLKSILVPGAEFLPYRDIFFFLKPLVDQLGGSMAGYGKQEERGVFRAEDGTAVAPVICYESVYGEYSTGYVRNGAQAIFIVTNDGWWDLTPGHVQHLQFASLRAIETRRSIARSANTGISGFINQRGDLQDATQYNEPIALSGRIATNDAITFYVKYGDLIGRVALFLSAILLLNTFVRGRMKK